MPTPTSSRLAPHSAHAAHSALVLALGVFVGACSPFERGPKVSLPSGELPIDHGEGAAADADLIAAIDAAALEFMDDAEVVGLGLAVIADGEVLLAAGYGWAELEDPRPLTATTPVLLSSVSKTFIGVAAMQGIEAGRLTLDDDISDLAGFTVDNPRVEGETISLRDTLTHNSGIEDSGEYEEHYALGDPPLALGDFLRGYLTKGGEHWRRRNYAARMPGEEFSYSNVGASLGAFGIGNSSDMEFRELVAAKILQPLAMVDSAYLLGSLPTDPAMPYATTRESGVFRAWGHYGYPTYPDGMLRASASDMGRYLAAIMGGGSLDGVAILTPESVETMLTIDADAGSDESGQAVAWAMRELDDRQLFGHNGGDYGSFTEMWFDREAGAGFVILLNTSVDLAGWEAAQRLERALLELAEGDQS